MARKQEIEEASIRLNRGMRNLRSAMKGIPIRTAGFKKDHDEAARAISAAMIYANDAKGLIEGYQKGKKGTSLKSVL